MTTTVLLFHILGQPRKQQRRKRLFEESTPSKTSSKVGHPSETKSSATEILVTPSVSNHDYIHTDTEGGNYHFIKEYLPEIREKMNELDKLQKINQQKKQQILSLENIKDNPKRVTFWTGFPNYETFLALFEYFQPRAKNLRYLAG